MSTYTGREANPSLTVRSDPRLAGSIMVAQLVSRARQSTPAQLIGACRLLAEAQEKASGAYSSSLTLALDVLRQELQRREFDV